jgi:hypothetical protein
MCIDLPPREAGSNAAGRTRTLLDVVERALMNRGVRRDVLIGLGMFLLALTASVGLLASAGAVTIGEVSIGTASAIGVGAAAVAAKAGVRNVVRRRCRKRSDGLTDQLIDKQRLLGAEGEPAE